MTVRWVPAADPRKSPECTLQRMVKRGRVAEACTSILPHADRLLDLILYMSRADGTFDPGGRICA